MFKGTPMLIQWDGTVIDKWLRLREGNEPTLFEICQRCYDDIIDGEILAENHLKPTNGEPIDKYLLIAEHKSYGTCKICKGRC
jgi:hypothetical protein